MNRRSAFPCVLALVAAVFGALPAVRAAEPSLDLSVKGALGTLNGAIFRQVSPEAGITGATSAFLRLETTGKDPSTGRTATYAQGYNTDAPFELDPVLKDVKGGSFTHAIRVGDIPRINIGGRWYREFLLDVNESGNANSKQISLDKLEIFLGTMHNCFGYPTFGNNAVQIFDLDSAGDVWIKLDDGLNSGKSGGDALAYIPDKLFTDALAKRPEWEYVILYCRFGDNLPCDSGFEQWSVSATGGPLTPVGEIRGYAFEDLDGNARDDAEPRKGGVTIYMDADGDGDFDGDEVWTTTCDSGEYCFMSLAAGLGEYSTFTVREVVPDGWVQTTPVPPPLTLDMVPSAGNGKNGRKWRATTPQLEPAADQQDGLAFGNFKKMAIRGVKFEDVNGNGERDADEPLLPGWTIVLSCGLESRYATTDANGAYGFTGLGPGTYCLFEVLQDGWVQTAPRDATCDVVPIWQVMAKSGTDARLDFGNQKPPLRY